LIIRGEFYG